MWKWWYSSIVQVSFKKGSDERIFTNASQRWMKVAQCSWAVRKIYLHIVCGTPIPPPSLICRGWRKCWYHYKYSRASLVVQHRACAPYPSPPPVFCDLSSFLYKAFYNPCAGGNAPHAWHWLHFLWIFSNRTLPDRRKRDPRSWQKYCPPWRLVCRLQCNRLLPCTDWQPDVYLVLSKCVQVRKKRRTNRIPGQIL